ncbi:MAG: 3-hydroxy-5-phosphonooxypentane-2,4-dione thiolase [Thermoleophilia bacterium]|nr:3-hydroxy-5-phosphonooxypentane-2,4-dione thiolase [Thermoleophilia bacterium]
MDWGMQNRLSRIIKPETKKTVMLAVDHGYFMGPTTGLEQLDKTVNPLLPYADTLMLTRGALRYYIDPGIDVPITLRVSGGTSILNTEMLLHEGVTCSVEDAIRLNASCVAFSIMVGARYERDTILAFAEIIDEARAWGLPTLCVTAVGRDMVRDAKYMRLASRLGAELGADIVKTYYVDDFETVTESCPVPVVIAGGKKIPEREALEMARGAIDAGAAGVDMGRNIFQSEDPVAMIQAVRAVVHEGAGAGEAMELYESKKSEAAARQ